MKFMLLIRNDESFRDAARNGRSCSGTLSTQADVEATIGEGLRTAQGASQLPPERPLNKSTQHWEMPRRASSPNLHPAIDDDIDSGHVRTVVAG
jgi:hypothetical protein